MKRGEFPATISGLDLADLVGLTPRRLEQLAEMDKIPKPEKKGAGYPTARTLKRLFEYYRELADGLPAKTAASRSRQADADADTAEMNAGKALGVLMLTSDARRLWDDGFVKIRDIILRTPGIAAKVKAELSDKLQKVKIGKHSPPQ